jgi:hypothetical protein
MGCDTGKGPASVTSDALSTASIVRAKTTLRCACRAGDTKLKTSSAAPKDDKTTRARRRNK